MSQRRLTEISKLVNERLQELLCYDSPELLWNSMAYSISAGGKRMRPALNIMACELVDGNVEETMNIACAIEMIHTYSLIHDDLPAIDNDPLRRGKPSNHMVFGEAQAILAGDGLLNYAYEVMCQNALKYRDNLKAHIHAMDIVARAAGVFGMVAGQVVDVALEGQSIDEETLFYIHDHKTSAMIEGALLSGVALASPGKEIVNAVSIYGKNLGLTFQIVDDVLDITADASIGKTTGKDAKYGKTTFPTIYGVEGSMRIAKEKTEAAKDALNLFGEKAHALQAFADFMLTRES